MTNFAAVSIWSFVKGPRLAPAAQSENPRAFAISQLGADEPWPHPLSAFVCATSGPAQRPVAKAQQPCWQSASLEHASKTVLLPRGGAERAEAGKADTWMVPKTRARTVTLRNFIFRIIQTREGVKG